MAYADEEDGAIPEPEQDDPEEQQLTRDEDRLLADVGHDEGAIPDNAQYDSGSQDDYTGGTSKPGGSGENLPAIRGKEQPNDWDKRYEEEDWDKRFERENQQGSAFNPANTVRGMASGDSGNSFENDVNKAVVKGFTGVGAPILQGAARLGQAIGLTDNAENTSLYKIGERIAKGSDRLAGYLPGNTESTIGKIAEGVAQVGPMLALGPLATAVLMGTQGAADQGEAASKAGASHDAQNKAVLSGAAGGATLGALMPILGKVLAPIARSAPGIYDFGKTLLMTAAREGAVFGGVGEAQEFLKQQIARTFYDPKAGYHPDIERALVNFGTGAVMGGARGAVDPFTRGSAVSDLFKQNKDPNLSGNSNMVLPNGNNQAQTTAANPQSAQAGTLPNPAGNTAASPAAAAADPTQTAAKAAVKTPGDAASPTNTIGNAQTAPPPSKANGATEFAGERSERVYRKGRKSAEAPTPVASKPGAGITLNLGEDLPQEGQQGGQNGIQTTPIPQPVARELPAAASPAPEAAPVEAPQTPNTGGAMPPREAAPGLRAPPEPMQPKAPKPPKVAKAVEGAAPPAPPQQGMPAFITKAMKAKLGAQYHPDMKPEEAHAILNARKGQTLDLGEEAAPQPPQRVDFKSAGATRAETPNPVDEAAGLTKENPTKEEKASGEYPKGVATVHGIDVAIENAKGSTRSGTGADGKPWSVKMPVHYGEIVGSKGADGDPVDAFIGNHPKSPIATVIDQKNPDTGKFDEHKVMLGFPSAKRALDAYHASFSDGKGPDRVAHAKPMSIADLKAWLAEGNTKKPAAGQGQVLDLGEAKPAENTPVTAAKPAEKIAAKKPPKVGKKGAKVLDLGKVDEVPEDYNPREERASALDKWAAMQRGDVPAEDAGPSETQQASKKGTDKEEPIIPRESDNEKQVKDAAGNVVALAKGRPQAKKNTHALLVAKQMFDENPMPTKPAETTPKVLHERAKAIMEHPDVKKLWNGYDPQDKSGKNPEALWMHEVNELARTKPENLTRQRTLDFLGREFELRHDAEAGVNSVRAQRTAESEARKKGDEPTDTGSDNDGPEDTTVHRPIYDMVQEFLKSEKGSVDIEKIKKDIFGGYSKESADVLKDHMRAAVQHPRSRTIGHWGLNVIDNHADPLYAGRDVNPTRDISGGLEAITALQRKLKQDDAPLMAKVKKMSPEGQQTFWGEVSAGVWGDRDLTRKDQGFDWRGRSEAYRRAAHEELADKVDKMSDEDFATRNELHDVRQEREKALERSPMIAKVLNALNIKDKDLATRIVDRTTTPADDATVGGEETMDMLRKLSKSNFKEGPYTQLSRRGKWAVMAHLPVDAPDNATQLNGSDGKPVTKYAFDTKAERDAFSEKLFKDGHNEPSDTDQVVDKDGNHINPETKRPFTKGDLEDDDTLTTRYVSDVNPTYLRRVGRQRDALRHAAELKMAGYEKVDFQPVLTRKANNTGVIAEHLGVSADQAFRHNEIYQKLAPDAKAAVQQVVNEMQLDLLGGNRPTNRRLKQLAIKGHDTDLAQSVDEWSQRTAQMQAHQVHDENIDKALSRLKELSAPHTGDPYTSAERMNIYNEYAKRLGEIRDTGNAAEGKLGAFIHRALIASSLDRLDTPRFILQNLTQQPTHSISWLGADHGIFRSARVLYRANRDLGIATSFKDAWDATKGFVTNNTPVDQFKRMVDRLKNPEEQDALQKMKDVNAINVEAAQQSESIHHNPVELDIGKGINPVGNALHAGTEKTLNALDEGLQYLSDLSRPINSMAELQNRAGTGLAAYRLARARGDSHESAIKYGIHAINETQVNYSDVNKPAYQRNKYLRIPLQFKHFGFQQIAWMGHDIARIIRNTNQGDRQKGLMRSGMLMGTIMAAAGVNGLPLEQIGSPILTMLKTLGLTDKDWGDVEQGVRHVTSQALGHAFGMDALGKPGAMAQKITDVLAHGLPRLLKTDLTSNLGLSDILTHGAPDYARVGSRDYYAHLVQWLAEAGMGSVGKMGLDAAGAVNDLVNGDPLKRAEALGKLPMPKVLADTGKAILGYKYGSVNDRGRVKSEPLSASEAALTAAGFKPSRRVDEGAFSSANWKNDKRRSAERSEAITDYVKAATGGENTSKHFAAAVKMGITPATLNKAVADVRNKNSSQGNINGVPVTNTNRERVKSLANDYNLK